LTVLSSLQVASMRPFCEKAQPRTAAVCAFSTVLRPSALGLHSRTVLSLEADAMRLLVLSYATLVTAPPCPRYRNARILGAKFHTITNPSSEPLTACGSKGVTRRRKQWAG